MEILENTDEKYEARRGCWSCCSGRCF